MPLSGLETTHMTKLSDVQLILLTSASQRKDRSLLPPPQILDRQRARIRRSLSGLLKRSFAEEFVTEREEQSWRAEGDRFVGVRVTDAGLSAILAVDPGAGSTAWTEMPDQDKASEPASDAEPTRPVIFRPGSKQALLVELLSQEGGASLNELTTATKWLPHTTRAALTGLRKRGIAVVREKVDGETRYRKVAERAHA